MARGRGRLGEEDDEVEQAPQLPPSAIITRKPNIPHEEEDEEMQKQRDLDDLLGEADSAPVSEPSDAEELFDEDLLQRYVWSPKDILSLTFAFNF